MPSQKPILSCAVSPALAWSRIVDRSLQAWETLDSIGGFRKVERSALSSWTCVDDLLDAAPHLVMFWFFQRKEAFLAQEEMHKWDRDRMEEYVLVPASPGFVSRKEFFFLSHYWRNKDHPDPDSEYLRLNQDNLRHQPWSYIWVDWTCTPQAPRSAREEKYFYRSLEVMSALIRNCGFTWYYPPWESRMWILYEIAEFLLTSNGPVHLTDDVRDFAGHVTEMRQVGVSSVLRKYHYKCTNPADQAYLTCWLELLVLLKNLDMDLLYIRRIVEGLTWTPSVRDYHMPTICLVVNKFEGSLTYQGQTFTFTPFPCWLSNSSGEE